LIYKGVIPACMAPEKEDDQALDKMIDEELEGDEEEEEAEAEEKVPPRRKPAPRAPSRPIAASKGDAGEVTAVNAFGISFTLLALILTPTMGLIFYFMRTMESIHSVLKTNEASFLGGMGVGLVASFVAAVIFTYMALKRT
jgi:hypothetical protein